MKRFLNCTSSELLQMKARELLEAIRGSEGRVLVCETIGNRSPLMEPITNAELAAAMGADMIILNLFDVDQPEVRGLPKVSSADTIREVKRLTGRPVGINLEPTLVKDDPKDMDGWTMTKGRTATTENAVKAHEMGADFIVLTGNPGTGVTNDAITDSLQRIRQALADDIILIAGKMHGSGIPSESGENIITPEDITRFHKAGADIILLPAPGTIPGITVEYIRELVTYSHSLGMLTITAIGTSQEGADKETIKRIALYCKMTGTDLHHLGDAGYLGMTVPENITAYSIAIRGIRHTYLRMAASILR
jgi:hypothetical protein